MKEFTELGGARSREEENAKGFKGGVSVYFRKVLEAGADGESGDVDFLVRDFLGREGFFSVVVCDEKVVAGGAGPGSVYFDRVSNDGDDGDAGVGGKVAFYHVGVEGIGVYDDVGFKVTKELSYGIFGPLDEGKRFAKVLLVSGTVNPGPDLWGVGGNLTVGAAEKAVDTGVAKFTGVCQENLRFFVQGVGEITSRAVMAISETGRKNENFRCHMKKIRVGSNRGSGVASTLICGQL